MALAWVFMLWPGAAAFAQAADAVTPPAAGAVYEDQYLSESTEPLTEAEEEAGAAPEGRRSLSIGYRFDRLDHSDLGAATEHGASVQWTRETLNYGNFELNGDLNYQPRPQTDPVFRGGQGVKFSGTLAQYRLPLSETWAADNVIGVQVARTNPLLSAGYAVQLPSSLLEGASTQWYGDHGALRLIGGRVGRSTGFSGAAFDADEGNLSGIGADWALSPRWRLAAQSWLLYDDPERPAHASQAAAIGYTSAAGDNDHRLAVLHSNGGRLGVWYDGDTAAGAWRHRYGLFRLGPGLQWTDAVLFADRRGGYWRSESANVLRTLSFGLDLEQTGLGSDPRVDGQHLLTAHATDYLRIDNKTRIGGGVAWSSQNPTDTAAGDRQGARLTGNVFRNSALGFTNVQTGYQLAREDGQSTHEWSTTWNQSWALPLTLEVSTVLSAERFQDAATGPPTRRYKSGLALRDSFFGKLYTNASFSLVRDVQRRATPRRSDFLSLQLDAFWPFLPDWEMGLQFARNQTETSGAGNSDGSSIFALPPARSEPHDDRVVFTLRWSIAGGRPFAAVGGATGAAGTGRIVGRVFLDENHDGIWNPGEKGLAGLPVYLDGHTAAQTDAEGRYEFSPVFAGDHRVSIAMEDVPLPWALVNEGPQGVQVPVRGSVTQDFALRRLDQ